MGSPRQTRSRQDTGQAELGSCGGSRGLPAPHPPEPAPLCYGKCVGRRKTRITQTWQHLPRCELARIYLASTTSGKEGRPSRVSQDQPLQQAWPQLGTALSLLSPGLITIVQSRAELSLYNVLFQASVPGAGSWWRECSVAVHTGPWGPPSNLSGGHRCAEEAEFPQPAASGKQPG